MTDEVYRPLLIHIVCSSTRKHFKFFRRILVSSKKQVLVSSCLSVRVYKRGSNCRIFAKFDTGDFYEDLSRRSDLIKIGQQYQALYWKTEVRFMLFSVE